MTSNALQLQKAEPDALRHLQGRDRIDALDPIWNELIELERRGSRPSGWSLTM
jgi:hypothetical protein